MSSPQPTPNLEGQGISLCPKPRSKPNRQRWHNQQLGCHWQRSVTGQLRGFTQHKQLKKWMSLYDLHEEGGILYVNLSKMFFRTQCPRSLKRGSAAARFLRLWFRIPPEAWISVCCECCVLSCIGLREGADHSSRGVLPTAVCLSVIMNPRQWGGLGPPGAVASL